MLSAASHTDANGVSHEYQKNRFVSDASSQIVGSLVPTMLSWPGTLVLIWISASGTSTALSMEFLICSVSTLRIRIRQSDRLKFGL